MVFVHLKRLLSKFYLHLLSFYLMLKNQMFEGHFQDFFIQVKHDLAKSCCTDCS